MVNVRNPGLESEFFIKEMEIMEKAFFYTARCGFFVRNVRNVVRGGKQMLAASSEALTPDSD